MCKLLEYMAFGLPCVAFDLTVSVDMVGDAGRFATGNDPVLLAQHVAELLDDPMAREELGAAGRARFLQSLSWDMQAKSLVRAYDHVLAQGRRKQAPPGEPVAATEEGLGVV